MLGTGKRLEPGKSVYLVPELLLEGYMQSNHCSLAIRSTMLPPKPEAMSAIVAL
jgi:hypothetical protein